VALSEKDGHVVWSRDVPAGTESSPLVWGTTVYFGDQRGNVYALRTRDGHLNWTYHAQGAVKGGPALSASANIVYFGDYAGRAYALDAGTGREVWAVSTSGAHFGLGSGNFYSSPAVAFGRVYMGNTDGRVYSFAAHSGKLAWATTTGAYVYSSPAVADVPGLGPTVYVGSYDGTFYAFDARAGRVRWSHAAGGRISGSPTIIGDVVYYANLGAKTSTGLDIRSGRTVFTFPEGAFNPVIADRGAVYLTGYANLFQLLPARLQSAATGLGATRAGGRAGSSGTAAQRVQAPARQPARKRK
jgi:outer membrane protein assembly factor BamB